MNVKTYSETFLIYFLQLFLLDISRIAITIFFSLLLIINTYSNKKHKSLKGLILLISNKTKKLNI